VLACSIVVVARKRKIHVNGDLRAVIEKKLQMIVIQMWNVSRNYLVAVVCLELSG
jgi:hypothetical protein